MANLFSNTVSIIDTATNLVVDTLGIYTRAHDAAAHPNGAEVYVTETSIDQVAVISVASKTRVDTIYVGDQPYTEGVFIGPGPALFASYFETGDTSEWSSTWP